MTTWPSATSSGSCGLRFPAAGRSQSGIIRGFEYSDAWVDDARLVVLNAMLARDKGADVQTRTRCVKACADPSTGPRTLERKGRAVHRQLPWSGQCGGSLGQDLL